MSDQDNRLKIQPMSGGGFFAASAGISPMPNAETFTEGLRARFQKILKGNVHLGPVDLSSNRQNSVHASVALKKH